MSNRAIQFLNHWATEHVNAIPYPEHLAEAQRLAKECVADAHLRLGGDPADDEYPDKPPRMRWATYNRLMDRLVAADGVADVLAARLLGKINPKANERVRNKSNRTTTKGKWHYSAFAPLVGAKRTSIRPR